VLHSRGQVLGSAQAKALLLCLHNLDVGILRALEPEARAKRQSLRDALRSAHSSPLVLAVPLAVALRLEALDLRQTVDAAGLFAARNTRRVDAFRAQSLSAQSRAGTRANESCRAFERSRKPAARVAKKRKPEHIADAQRFSRASHSIDRWRAHQRARNDSAPGDGETR